MLNPLDGYQSTSVQIMDKANLDTAARIGAYAAFAGSACAITGAVLLTISGADLDVALATDDIAGYLTKAGANAGLLATNLTFWIVMVFLIGIAGTAMSALCRRRKVIARMALLAYWSGVPLVISAYVVWLAIIVRIAPDNSPTAVLVADTLGWYATHADWVATILVLSIGPLLISIAGRGEWVPTWLFRGSLVATFAGILNAAAMLFGGAGLGTYGFAIIPVGVA
jgi:hypothetical protein